MGSTGGTGDHHLMPATPAGVGDPNQLTFFDHAIASANRLVAQPQRVPAGMTTIAAGTEVTVRMDDGSFMLTTTTSEPWQLGHGQWVVKVDGISGGYDLARVSLVDGRSARGHGEVRS